MGHVISPLSLRLGVSRKWSSNWYTINNIDYRFALFHSLDLQSIFSNFYSLELSTSSFFDRPDSLVISHFDLNFVFGKKITVDFFVFDSTFVLFFKLFFSRIKSKFIKDLSSYTNDLFFPHISYPFLPLVIDYIDYVYYTKSVWEVEDEGNENHNDDLDYVFKEKVKRIDYSKTNIPDYIVNSNAFYLEEKDYIDYVYYTKSVWEVEDEGNENHNDDLDYVFKEKVKRIDYSKTNIPDYIVNSNAFYFKENSYHDHRYSFNYKLNGFVYDYENFLSYLIMRLLLYFDAQFLKTVLTSFSYTFDPFKDLQINYIPLPRNAITVNVLGYYICGRLALREDPKKIIIPLIKDFLQKPHIVGFKVVFCGRFSRNEMATYTWQKWGIVSTNTLVSKLDYGLYTVNLKYGVCGIKVWLQQNDVAPVNSLLSYKPVYLNLNI